MLSPFLRNARLRAARKWLNGKVLDIGCGSGRIASFVSADNYVGYDRDVAVIFEAKQAFPSHLFTSSMPSDSSFDTIVALALVEHLPDPAGELVRWHERLKAGGRIVLTTPHKAFRKVHDLGAKAGIFSRDAADEHEVMFDRSSLIKLAKDCGFEDVTYQRFLFGANQLLVAKKR
ncbi:class I SAM-dependent methyltransferase [Mesorhizobium sp. NBSH29]|uniref:class I SAM-dependent methyltransferase n=1 Tax=Mesorhizobium sp. NBSH29 TaxID=2654249 RepID=UPI001896A415|nr:class I SAM-dependent methyltransferase [Mesorhizobium sp. NBSH29]